MTGPVMRPVALGSSVPAKPVAVIPTGHPTSVVQWLGPMPPQGTYLYAAPQPAPAIDLEQFREAVESLRLGATRAEHHEECDRLLALIDGQASQHPDSVLLDSGVIRYPSRNEFGEQCHVIHRGLDLRACIAAGIEESKPTKGEGE